jgi:signal transduction histidine kinase/HPt (histidine-containing phosphotransfer) domain-containing protein
LPSFDARILIAEDNPVNQDVASGVLELMGCRTVSAPNGRAAFRLFAQEKFDAILMDCEMPIMDGIEATHRIRELEAMQQGLADSDQGKQRIPIIASTAHAISEVREKCLAAGMDDFLVKPYDERQMAETLLRWLKPRGGEATINPANQADPAVEDATSPTQDDVIDRAVIDGLRAMAPPGRRSPFGRALARFLETTPPIVASIRDNCDKSDAEALWRGAHYLKSSASALGAKQLSLRCAEIESRTRDSGIDTARPLVEFLDDDLAAAISGLKAVAGTFMNLPDTDDAVALAGAPTLLIVDDDPVVRSLMRDALEDDGFTVIEAENGIEACQLCEAAVPALLVVDAVMPVMDGFELCRALRQQPQTAQVPILMATGLDDPGSIARAYEVGATDFIAKPLNWLMLSNRVRYMLRGARAFDDLVAARDAAEAANRAKSEFLANMSHELRTPLNAIIGFASIMQQGIRGPIDSRYVDDAKIIVNGGSHLLAIINDILDIAKAEANLLELSEDMVDIAETVAFSADMVAEMAKNGGIVCSYAVDNGLPAFWGDAKKLRQVLINLLSNAVKFTPAGGSVTVSACREDDGGVALRIADTGIGVAPGDIPVALAPFGQVDGTVTRRYEGVGLGLPLSKRLVEMHDGVFEIDSEPGEGTTITVRLPAKRFPGETVKPANAKAYAD